MGSKAQVRSMQRGAAKRDRAAPDKTPDYAKVKPKLRNEDLAHLGLTKERFDELARRLTPKIKAYAAGGFRKPAQVSKLLNREKIKTLAGAEWNPRLVYFLLSKVYSIKPASAPKTVKTIPSTQASPKLDGSRKREAKANSPRPYSPGGFL